MLTTMSDVDIELIGDEELLAVLKDLDYKTQHRFLKRIVSDSANIHVKAARRAIPVRRTKLTASGQKWHPPGAGKKSIGKKMGKSRRTATVFVGPRTNTGSYHNDGWFLKFWEYGTKNSPPNMGITAAYHANKQAVEDNMINSVRKIITRTWNKLR